tara:strand:- start:635 stop:1048 length:414 start_codon:yes stop_codon:yes gene_type:complete
MNLLDKLPDEILDIIYEYYWRDVFTNVLLDIKKPIILEQKINTFLNKYCMTQNYFNNVYTHYLSILNEDIKNIIKNKSLIHICTNNKLLLFFCFDISSDIIKNIHISLQYICTYSICKSSYMRYNTYQRFIELSKNI